MSSKDINPMVLRNTIETMALKLLNALSKDSKFDFGSCTWCAESLKAIVESRAEEIRSAREKSGKERRAEHKKRAKDKAARKAALNALTIDEALNKGHQFGLKTLIEAFKAINSPDKVVALFEDDDDTLVEITSAKPRLIEAVAEKAERVVARIERANDQGRMWDASLEKAFQNLKRAKNLNLVSADKFADTIKVRNSMKEFRNHLKNIQEDATSSFTRSRRIGTTKTSDKGSRIRNGVCTKFGRVIGRSRALQVSIAASFKKPAITPKNEANFVDGAKNKATTQEKKNASRGDRKKLKPLTKAKFVKMTNEEIRSYFANAKKQTADYFVSVADRKRDRRNGRIAAAILKRSLFYANKSSGSGGGRKESSSKKANK
tara:strand:+ start:145 stop:1272 length:1128 start_codon:yes stop_codon:yes gene_type:complete